MIARLAVAALLAAFPIDAQAAHYVIEIGNMVFGPAPAHLVAGDTIEWKNNDIFRHTATARTGWFDLDLPPGARATVTLKRAGTINVYCRFHPTMTVQLAVTKR